MNLLSVLLALAAPIGAAAEQAATLQQALDQVTEFEVEEVPVGKAFQALTDQTGIQFFLAPETLDLLPYGEDTRVSVEFENVPLREGLDQLLLPLGMSFEVASEGMRWLPREDQPKMLEKLVTPEGVRVLPKPALVRIGRRPTWEELDTLAFVRGVNWLEKKDRNALRDRLQFRGDAFSWSTLALEAQRIGAGPGDEVLSLACESRGWTWFPEGDRIVVLPAREQLRRQLQCGVSFRCTHRSLVEVLQQLARQAHVDIRHEPGVIASLPAQTRDNFSLLLQDVTAAEALDQIAAATGLGYRLDQNAVVFYHPGAVASESADSGGAKSFAQDPFIAKLVLPAAPGEAQVEILIRKSELSPDAIRARDQLVQKADEILRLQLEPTADD